jgi:hypothetical protein
VKPDRPSTFHSLHSSCADDATDAGAKSFRNLLQGRPFDPYAMKRVLPQEWGAFCRRQFRSSSEVAIFFDVSPRTAEYWWHGNHTGGAVHMALVALSFPAEFHEMMRRAA